MTFQTSSARVVGQILHTDHEEPDADLNFAIITESHCELLREITSAVTRLPMICKRILWILMGYEKCGKLPEQAEVERAMVLREKTSRILVWRKLDRNKRRATEWHLQTSRHHWNWNEPFIEFPGSSFNKDFHLYFEFDSKQEANGKVY
jgi:hypothetical protein